MSKTETTNAPLEDRTEEEVLALFGKYKRLENIFLSVGLILVIVGTIIMIIVSYRAPEYFYIPIIVSIVGIASFIIVYPISRRRKEWELELYKQQKRNKE